MIAERMSFNNTQKRHGVLRKELIDSKMKKTIAQAAIKSNNNCQVARDFRCDDSMLNYTAVKVKYHMRKKRSKDELFSQNIPKWRRN
jgi:hypothetical protein